MRNDAEKQYPDNLNYTMLGEDYKGYTIMWAVTRSRSDPGKWLGHFRAIKDETPTIFGSLGASEATDGRAQDKAIEAAKSMVDDAVASKD